MSISTLVNNSTLIQTFSLVDLIVFMIRIDLKKLLQFLTVIDLCITNSYFQSDLVKEEALKADLQELRELCANIGLTFSIDQIDRILNFTLAKQHTSQDLYNPLVDLRTRLFDELKKPEFFLIPLNKLEYFRSHDPFGSDVNRAFPSAGRDIEEAAKCLAVNRYTASVFHLMRVMEYAVQEFGTKLQITLVGEKQWQVLLDQINKAIKQLPEQTLSDKEKKSLYGESAAHLYNVKIAWRNPVMHPRDFYNEEEAVEIYNNVRTFVVHLATKIL